MKHCSPLKKNLIGAVAALVVPLRGILGTMNTAPIILRGKTLVGTQRGISALRKMAAQANDAPEKQAHP